MFIKSKEVRKSWALYFEESLGVQSGKRQVLIHTEGIRECLLLEA